MPGVSDMDVLARTIWGEARGEGETGMHAVANVIMNRLTKAQEGSIAWWGNTVKGICQAPKQFSCWNQNDPNCAKIRAVTADNDAFAAALALAGLAVNGVLHDITHGATSYYADNIPAPYWARDRTPAAHIGHHLFFVDTK